MFKKIEKFLYNRGFELQEVRQLIALQLVLALSTSVIAICFSGFGFWGLAYCGAALLATVNFYHLVQFVQKIVYVQKGAVLASTIRFYGRLILSGVLLYALVVLAKANVVAVLCGVSTVVATSIIWGIGRIFEQNVKEA